MDNKYKDEELKLLYLQMFSLIVFVGAFSASVYFTYKEIERVKNNKENKREAKENEYFIFNREFIVAAAIILLYVSIKNKDIAVLKGEDTKTFNLQIVSSLFLLIATFIVLYINLVLKGDQVGEEENPEL